MTSSGNTHKHTQMSDILEVAAKVIGLGFACYALPFGATYLYTLFKTSADFSNGSER